MKRFAVFFALALFLLAPATLSAAECQFVLGFKTLRDLVGHDVVGECLENQRYSANGNAEQQTTGGLLVWRKADNWTAFTDGYRTWINGPNGLVQRLNTERFEWEPDYAPGGGSATPAPTPTPSSTADTTATPAPATTPLPTPEATATPGRTPTPIPTPDRTPSPTPTPDMTLRVAAATREVYALPWARDGESLTKLEKDALLYLQSVAGYFPDVAMVLVRRPWLRDGVNWEEHQVIIQLPHVINWLDAESALRFVKMPFLEASASMEDSVVLYTLVDMMTYSPNPDKREVLREALADPLLRDGIEDGYRNRVEFVAIGKRSPEIVAAIYSLPWIQDGVEGSEWAAMTVLSEASIRAPQFIPELVSHSWVQDGLDKGEIDRAWKLLGQSSGPAPTPTPDISAEVAAAKREISALPWVRDDVKEPPDWGISSFPLSTLEELRRALHRLQTIAENSPRAARVLVRRPWLRDDLSEPEYQALMRLSYFAKFDAESTLKLVRMPFLHSSVDRGDASILHALDSMIAHSTNKQEVLREALAHPLLRGGIEDGYRTRVEFVAIGQRSPEIATAIYSLPWIQDGLEGSEWEAITVLYEATYFKEFIPVLVSYPWVRDGLTKAEQKKVWELMREYF